MEGGKMGRGKILEEDPYWGTSQFVLSPYMVMAISIHEV